VISKKSWTYPAARRDFLLASGVQNLRTDHRENRSILVREEIRNFPGPPYTVFMRYSCILPCIVVMSLSLFSGCGNRINTSSPTGKETGVPFVDLVTFSSESRLLHHRDQTFYGLVLGETQNFEATLTRAVEITLGGYYGKKNGGRPSQEGRIDFTISSDEDEESTVKGTIHLAASSEIWKLKANLNTLPPGPCTLVLRPEIPHGHRVILRKALIRQEIQPVPETAEKPIQLLLISVDTLREDALGYFGASWKTPNLDEMIRQSQVFSPAYPGGAWTKPSHATMLTGYRGDTHEILSPEDVLAPRLPTIASRFKSAGFATAGFVYDCKWLDPKWGFDKGFDQYHVDPYSISRSFYPTLNWMAEHRDQPFFVFFHTFEPHSDFFHLPYESPGTDRAGIRREFGYRDYGCEDDACSSRRLELINDGKLELLPGEADVLKELYGRGVRETDRSLGEFFGLLKDFGLWDHLEIILTSDHGEGFYEHGKLLHGQMWNEVIRVPLIVKWPGGAHAGEGSNHPAAAIDIAPTLLQSASLDRGDLPGIPLQEMNTERVQYVYGGSRAVIDGKWKVIFTGDLTRAKAIYDLEKDPLEQHDLKEERPDIFTRLRAHAQKLTAADRILRDRYSGEEKPQAHLSEKEKEKLRALGYLD